MSLETVPKDQRNLRACLLCSLVKTLEQFEYDGCDNCEEYLRLKNNRERVYDCTSSNFDGLIALMGPEDSWVAKWQRIGRFVKGCYAISVTGRLHPSTVRDLKSKGVYYRSRDTSLKTWMKNCLYVWIILDKCGMITVIVRDWMYHWFKWKKLPESDRSGVFYFYDIKTYGCVCAHLDN